MKPVEVKNQSKFHSLFVTILFTVIYCLSSFANAEVISRYGLEVKNNIKKSSLGRINRSGELIIKRAIQRADGHQVPRSAELKKVTVHAKVLGRAGSAALEVGQRVVDEERLSYIRPECIPVEKPESDEEDDSHHNRWGYEDEEEDCIEQPLKIQEMSLYNSGNRSGRQWVLLTAADLDVLLVEVESMIPMSYEVSRNSLGSRKKADKFLGSSKMFRMSPTTLDSVAVKASKENVTVQSVVVWFEDGSKRDIRMYGKVKKNRVKTKAIAQPLKKVVGIEVSATSRKLFGSRGYFEVFADQIITPIP